MSAAKGRANAWGAKGMLAKVYLARSGWKGGTRDNADLEKSKEIAADVINNSGLSLYENYEDLFKYKHNNNPESLIAMQWVPLGDWGVCNTLLADLAGNSKMTSLQQDFDQWYLVYRNRSCTDCIGFIALCGI